MICEGVSREDVAELEELAVNAEFVARVDTYNLKTGGEVEGSGIHGDVTRSKISNTRINKGLSSGDKNPMYGTTGDKSPNFSGALEITHIATGAIIGTFAGRYELEAADFCRSDPHKAAQGKRKRFGRTHPDGSKERAAYTARFYPPVGDLGAQDADLPHVYQNDDSKRGPES